MSYDYQTQRPHVLTDDGQRMFLAIRDKAEKCIKLAGAVRSQEMMVGSGDTWTMLACMDRLVELKYLREIDYGHCVGQHRIFVAGRTWSDD